MYQTFIIKRPPGLNSLVRSSRASIIKSSQIKKQWTNAAKQQALRELEPIEGKVWLIIHITYTNSNNDPDNMYVGLKPVLDGLVAAKILATDSVKTIQSPQLYSYSKGEANLLTLYLFDNPVEFWEYVLSERSLLFA